MIDVSLARIAAGPANRLFVLGKLSQLLHHSFVAQCQGSGGEAALRREVCLNSRQEEQLVCVVGRAVSLM